MRSCPENERTLRYLDGQLGKDSLHEAETHLAACALCQETRARVMRVNAALSTLAAIEPPPSHLEARILTAARSRLAQQEARSGAWFWTRSLWPAGVAAALVAVILGGLAGSLTWHPEGAGGLTGIDDSRYSALEDPFSTFLGDAALANELALADLEQSR